jgi:hypothetical protein
VSRRGAPPWRRLAQTGKGLSEECANRCICSGDTGPTRRSLRGGLQALTTHHA